MFEGVVGRNGLGNIAIDDVSIAPGVCPTAPQVIMIIESILNSNTLYTLPCINQ